MREKDSMIRLFAEIDKKSGEVHYHRDSWEGPIVTPRRFYPSRLVSMVRKKNEGPGNIEYEPDSFELVRKAPKDEKINAYVLGDTSYFSPMSTSSIVQPSPGKNYLSGETHCSQHFGRDETDMRLVSVSYCSLSQRDLDKTAPSEK